MAAKPFISAFHGTFYLPVLLFAMLAGGLFFYCATPAVPTLSISAMEPALFNQLRQLWNAFLSWFTPPCLFVVLNGIIVALSATSGALSSSGSQVGSSDFCPKLLSVKSGHPKHISEAPAEGFSNQIPSSISLSTRMQEHKVQTLLMTVSPLSTKGRSATFDSHEIRQDEDLEFYDAKYEADAEGDYSREFSNRRVGSGSLFLHCGDSEIEENEEIGDEHDCGNERACIHAGQELGEKKIALFHREEGDFVQMNSRSMPSSPQSVTPPKPHSIQRSFSVDSAPYHTDQGSPNLLSAESLSDEAFRKRVEDFISKMNAQLRNEVE